MAGGDVLGWGPGGPGCVVLAPDSFKGTLTAVEACRAIERGLRRVWPEVRCLHRPMADGGEGTVDALVDATGGVRHASTVEGPLGEPVEAVWGELPDGTAVIEVAAASGLSLVPAGRLDARVTSTFGAGQLVLEALGRGCRRLVIGLGGSATNDGGAGLVQALGVSLLDASGRELPRGGAALAGLGRIDASGLDPRLARAEVLVASDVTNPLCGPQGASAVFGPQKGADAACVAELDRALAHYARCIHRDLGRDVAGLPGAGAAGGLGAALLAFTDARLVSGAEVVIAHNGLRAAIEAADLVVAGEGRMDAQSLSGKAPAAVARLARELRVPVVGLAGSLGPGHEQLQASRDSGRGQLLASRDSGRRLFDGLWSVVHGELTLDDALADPSGCLARAANRMARDLADPAGR